VERLADGGAVMFVDHEQARLAGRISERWRLDDSGQVTVVAGAGDGARSGSAPESVVAIELTGLEPSSATLLGGLPGVLSCGDGVVRVSSGESDAVLRQVLGWDGVHVTGVRTEQSEPSGQAERGKRAAGR
jgi:hypothetical protein